MARYKVCFIKENIIHYMSSGISEPSATKEITLKQLNEIEEIGIHDKRTHQFVKRFIERSSLINYREEIISLGKEKNKLKTELEEVKERLRNTEQQLEFFKSLSEII